MQTPTIGRIIIAVVMARGELVERPAIITRTWAANSTSVQATVFPDAMNDELGVTQPKSSLMYDETGANENTWHWPARV